MTEPPNKAARKDEPQREPPSPARAPEPPLRAATIIVGVTILAIVALSLWYWVRP